MAQITINEVSQNYSYNVGTNAFCTVALPITACWGPAYEDPASLGISLDEELEACSFQHFAANREGLEAFIAAYRGPASNYRITKDYSYYIALTLLTSGYDVEVCRLCPGTHAQATFTATGEGASGAFVLKAKYPGSFGNNLQVTFNKVPNRDYWNLITYIIDANGTKTAVENLVFVFDVEHSTDTILHISEINSAFFDFVVSGITTDDVTFDTNVTILEGGTDKAADTTASEMISNAVGYASLRFQLAPGTDSSEYVAALTAAGAAADVNTASAYRYSEWIYLHTMYVMDILKDTLTYNCNRIILPGWDDQDISQFTGQTVARLGSLNPLHAKLLEVAFYSRCATAYIDIPKTLARSGVWNDDPDPSREGYAQKLGTYLPTTVVDDGLFATHSALFAPWGQYIYAGTGKQQLAPPGFLALLIDRAMVLNQANQYEWIAPSSRKHNLTIGKLAYNVPKKLLDQWQGNEGVSLNVIANIPDLGTSVWGDSTLFNVPPATWNALQNLTTRKLINALRDQSYRCGIAITFQYNNEEAYSKFEVGMTPLLDTMRNVGAIEGYDIEMSADINGLDSVNANSVIGKVAIFINGIISDITIDLVALPAAAMEA